jgi:hypothetical protein
MRISKSVALFLAGAAATAVVAVVARPGGAA